MIKLTKDMAAPLKHLNASLCSFYFSKITAMAIEEFNKRFEKKSAFEALLIETRWKSVKSSTWNKVVIYEVLLPAISRQIRRWAIPSVLA